MSKFFSRLFSRASSFRGSQSSLNESQHPSKTSSSFRTSSSLENLSSYHVNRKELEKNKLHKAAWEGDLLKVQKLARPGQINLKDPQMRTPLHLAVVKGHLEIVRFLVHEDAKLDLVDSEERTPLIKAVLSGNQNPPLNYRICQVLIEGGAGDYINAIDKHGRNALHYAIDFGNENLVGLFLAHENCDPNIRDRDQMTPLHLAIKRNNLAIVQLLLSEQRDQQVDPNMINRNGQTPLHVAASVGYVDIVRSLLSAKLNEPCDPTILDSQQLTAYESAKHNHQEACAKLIEEYQEKRPEFKLTRQTTASINVTSSITMTPASNLQRDQDETSDDSISVSISKPSKSSPRRFKRPSDQWSDDNDPPTNASRRPSHGIIGLHQINPLQPKEPKTNTSSTLNNLFKNNPLQVDSKKAASSSQRTKSTSFFGIGPIAEHVDSDTSMSLPIDKPIKSTPVTSQSKLVTSNPIVLHPTSNTKSWSDDTISASLVKKPEPRTNSWDTSVSDDDPTIAKPKPPLSNLQKTQPFTASTMNLSTSDSDNNSVETEIRKFDIPKSSNEKGIGNLVNKQIEVQSPVSEESSWTTSPVPFKQELPTTKGVSQLVVLPPKTDESTWDDSRPLSDNLKPKRKSNDLSASDIQSKGVDDLIKNMDALIHSDQKQPAPKVIGKLVVSSMADRRPDSVLSGNTSHDDDYEESWKKKSEEWSIKTTNDNHLKNIPQVPPSTLNVSTSSSHNVQINELKENIKKLEENQENTHELKRQLKEMENEKNNLEKLYQENHQILRDIATKLEREQNEKSRLERTTETLNNELKKIRDKFQSLEDEKEHLNQCCLQLKEERDQHDEKLRVLQATSLNSSFREDDTNKIPTHHREKFKFLSEENNDLHYQTKELQSNLDLHKESLDRTIRYKIDLEKALEDKHLLQREFERLRAEKIRIEEEKFEYQTKYNNLQDEIRLILLDRSKLEQKLTGELHEYFQQKQRSTEDRNQYQIEIEQLNIKLADAEAQLVVLQTQNESLLATKAREITNEYDTVKQRLNQIEFHADQRYQANLTKPLTIRTSQRQHPLSSSYSKPPILQRTDDLNKTFPALQQQQQHKNENYLIENSRQMRTNTERMKSELDRLREDFDRLVSNYEPTNHLHHQSQLHSQIDTFRQFYEQEFRQRQLLTSKLSTGIKSNTIIDKNSYRTSFDNRLLKERLETAIDSSLAEQRLKTITEIPRQASALLTINTTDHGVMSSVEFLRKHYHS